MLYWRETWGSFILGDDVKNLIRANHKPIIYLVALLRLTNLSYYFQNLFQLYFTCVNKRQHLYITPHISMTSNMDNMFIQFSEIHLKLTLTAKFENNITLILLDISLISHPTYTDFSIFKKPTSIDCIIL